jgi:hypothetical protein
MRANAVTSRWKSRIFAGIWTIDIIRRLRLRPMRTGGRSCAIQKRASLGETIGK